MKDPLLLSALEAFRNAVQQPWSADSIEELAKHGSAVGDVAGWLLQADYSSVVLGWLAESVQPTGGDHDESHVKKSKIFKQATEVASSLGDGRSGFTFTTTEKTALARALGRAAWAAIEERADRELKLRSAERRQLLMEAGTPPRCYLCGARFGETAIQRFNGDSLEAPQATPLVDFLFPRGLRGRDFLIHVEHVRPLARGGADTLENLRLACAFCNHTKSDVITMFDRTGYGRVIIHPQVGPVRAPHPSWAVRLLALSGSCIACGRDSRSGKLVVAPAVMSRNLNPMNLRVYCELHDPISDLRLVTCGLLTGGGLGT